MPTAVAAAHHDGAVLAALLGASFGRREAPGVVAAAVAAGLVESGCYCHDSVRDAPGSNRAHNRRFVLWGDSLLARAHLVAADLGPTAVRVLARTLAEMQEQAITACAPPLDGRQADCLSPRRAGILWAGAGQLGCGQAETAPDIGEVVCAALRQASRGEEATGLLARLPAGPATATLTAVLRGRCGPRVGSAAYGAGQGQAGG
jgi:hypothetical protein